jgi:transaldolase
VRDVGPRPSHSNPQKPLLQTAIERAVVYSKCASLSGDAKAACVFDKALVNVGALFAERVSGRVSTEVDSRCAHDAAAMVARGKGLVEEYEAMGVPRDRVLLRLPATWEGVEAARALEAAGLRTHVILVASFTQAAAAAQAGAAVVQPNAGHLGDWFRAHPNAIRDPRGPREDSGYASSVHPGIELSKRIWAYCKTRHPGTKVMVSGVRSREDALALCGVDYIVAGPRVLDALAATPTRAGYNDGLVGAVSSDEDGVAPLTAAAAAAYAFDAVDDAPVTKQLFEEGLGATGRDVLKEGVARLGADVDRLMPMVLGIVSDNH